MRFSVPFRFAACLLLLLVAGCDASDPPSDGTLAARFEDSARYDDLATVVETAGLTARLAEAGPFTVFAPTNEAFEALGDGLVGAVLTPAQRTLLTRLLAHHIVPRELTGDDLADGATFTTLAGTTLTVERTGPAVFVNGVPVSDEPEVVATNGVAFRASNVMLTALSSRERVALSPTMGTFRGLDARTGTLAEVTGPVTILAPIDDAFLRLGSLREGLVAESAILERAIGGHVLPGDIRLEDLPDGATVETASGVDLDVTVRQTAAGFTEHRIGGIPILVGQQTADGRVYVLGDVMLATLSLADLLRIAPRTDQHHDALARYPAEFARLSDTDDALTVFATPDEAYASRAPDVTAALAEPINAPLARRVALATVVEGEWIASDLEDGQQLAALDGTVHTVRRGEATPPRIQREDLIGRGYVGANGVLYILNGFVYPAVDLFDSSLLYGLTVHVRNVRLQGQEALLRGLEGTVFGFSNDAYAPPPEGGVALGNQPDLGDRMRHNMTTERLGVPNPLPQSASFVSLLGIARVMRWDATREAVVIGFEGEVSGERLYGGSYLGPSFDDRGYVYGLSSTCSPPDSPPDRCVE